MIVAGLGKTCPLTLPPSVPPSLPPPSAPVPLTLPPSLPLPPHPLPKVAIIPKVLDADGCSDLHPNAAILHRRHLAVRHAVEVGVQPTGTVRELEEMGGGGQGEGGWEGGSQAKKAKSPMIGHRACSGGRGPTHREDEGAEGDGRTRGEGREGGLSPRGISRANDVKAPSTCSSFLEQRLSTGHEAEVRAQPTVP